MGRLILVLSFSIALSQNLTAVTPVATATFTDGEQGRIVVETKINGKGPYPFVFDTGSINILSLELANSLGIPVSGEHRINAFGGTLETASAEIDSIQLGDFAKADTVTMPHSKITVIGGGPFTKGGPVGFLGWEFLANLVIEIDYEHGVLRFYDPATYTYAGHGTRLPVTLGGNFVTVPASVYGENVSLMLDSGNENSGLVLFRGLIKKRGLHADTVAVTGYGFGGLTRAMITRAPFLEIGGFKIDAPRTDLSVDEEGVGAAGDLDGNVGAPIMRQFTWVFDVPHKSVYVQPNAWFHRPALEDHSGLVLDSRGAAAKVLFVYPKSPAEVGGIKAGDELMGKDGRTLTTDEWHDLLDGAPGTEVLIRVSRGRKSKAVSLRLKAYL